MSQICPDHLKLGETFFEDCRPEVWQVIEIGSLQGAAAEVIGYLEGYPKPDHIGETSYWGGSGMYAPLIYEVKEENFVRVCQPQKSQDPWNGPPLVEKD